LPTYAKFNHVFKNYIENTHEKVLKAARSEELFDLINPEKEDKYFDGEIKWLIEEMIDMEKVLGMKDETLKEISSRFDEFFAN
jgi:hypothetical protein